MNTRPNTINQKLDPKKQGWSMITIIAMVLELHRFTAFLGSFFPSQDFLMWCYCWSPIKAPPPLEFKLDQEMPILPLTDLQRCLEILNKLKSDKLIGETCSAKCLSLITLLLDFIGYLSWLCSGQCKRQNWKSSYVCVGVAGFEWIWGPTSYLLLLQSLKYFRYEALNIGP